MKQILNDLCEFLNQKRFHLIHDEVVMCEMFGIGSIYIRDFDLREEVFEFLKKQDLNVFLTDYVKYNEIRFYTDKYKEDIECHIVPEHDKFGEWSDSDLINWYWQRVSNKLANEFFSGLYQRKGSSHNDIRYNLQATSHNPVISQTFVTHGSSLLGNRKVIILVRIREPDQFELI